MGDWQEISSAYAAYANGKLRECEVILTLHSEDLYPVCAYWLTDIVGPPNDVWMRAIEGPEDVNIEGANAPLYREPTHWQALPAPPAAQPVQKEKA